MPGKSRQGSFNFKSHNENVESLGPALEPSIGETIHGRARFFSKTIHDAQRQSVKCFAGSCRGKVHFSQRRHDGA